jgi:Ca2+-binding RTX toxin-like protein
MVELSDIETGDGGFVINGVSQFDNSGKSVSGAGDVNGDGLADLIIGALNDDPNSNNNSGASFVVFGKATTTKVELSDVDAGTGGFTINGVSANDLSGYSVSGAGDVNGDGLADLIVGARDDDPNGGNSGASFVVFGKATTTTVQLSDVDAGTGGFVINGVGANDQSGRSVSDAGDVNGDGLADLIVGARGDSPNGNSNSGASFVVFGKATTTTVQLSDVEAGTGGFVINGVSASDLSGESVSSAGDVNGDGLADLIVGAHFDDPNGTSSGASFVVFGKTGTTAVQLSDVKAGTGGFAINGVSADDLSGKSVSGAGDVNGDGLADLIVGAYRDDPSGGNSGASFVVFGKTSTATVQLSDVEVGTGGFVINGASAGDYAGRSVSGGGDVNGDGLADVIVGAYYDDPNGNSASGASFVVFGVRTPVTAATPTDSTDLPSSTVVTNADGTTISSFSNTTGATARAVLIEGTGSGNIVAATLPNRVTLSSNGAGTAQETTPATASIEAEIAGVTDPANGQALLLAAAADFMSGKAAGTLFDIRSLTPTVSGAQSLTESIILTGSTDGSGEDAFVIDATGLPSGTVIQLDHIEFAAITGAVTLTGGAGQNYVIGDDFAQDITLGALDDTLFGGGGDDVVASAFGEDILYGNTGNDTVKGGGGQDSLYGGQGDDAIEGENDADTLFGNIGADTVNGGQGADVVYGNQAGDVVSGGADTDSLFGGQGDDILYGNQGADNLRWCLESGGNWIAA